MKPLPIVATGQKALSAAANACRTVNMFPHKVGDGLTVMYPVHGMIPWLESITGGKVRGGYTMNGVLYAVVDSSLYSVSNTGPGQTTDTAGTLKLIGAVEPSNDPATIKGNGAQVAVLSGGVVHVLTVATGALTRVLMTSENFIVGAMEYLNGYGIYLRAGTGQWYISALYEFTSVDPLDYATAEASPDHLVTMVVVGGELHLFGGKTVEVWYNTGDTGGEDADGFPFARRNGATVEHGISSPRTALESGDSLIWLDDNRQVVRLVGYQVQKISSPALDHELALAGQQREAYAVTYALDGHEFYCLTFRRKDGTWQTWAFDLSMNDWRQRSSGTGGGAWWPTVIVNFGTNVICGGSDSGKLMRLDVETFAEAGRPMLRSHILPKVGDGDMLRHLLVEFRFERGVGLNDGQGRDPVVEIDWSDDDCHTWSNPVAVSLGKIGEYRRRAVLRRLGRSRERYYRLHFSDPVKTVLTGAAIEASR